MRVITIEVVAGMPPASYDMSGEHLKDKLRSAKPKGRNKSSPSGHSGNSKGRAPKARGSMPRPGANRYPNAVRAR